MKNLVLYIKEAYETYRLNNVKVKYDCAPKEFIIEAPETFEESDLQTYMDDKLLGELPSNVKYAETFFGKNSDNIYDVYFEYDTYTRLSTKPYGDINLKWDPKYKQGSSEDITLNYYKITNLKYIIEFDRFDILNGSKDNVENVLKEIFMATVSNDNNKYPIEISLDPKNIEYHK